ncbi:MAG: hypothetical protein K8L99_17025, partial [Anaerolineae bacterium]|nr:hypothetical protein [Anaerolineae bacterium]
IPDDPLKFLYIPDQVEALMVADLARQIHAYQVDHAEAQITKAVMVTMGGLLPGVLLHDHLAWNPDPLLPPVEFGTMGVQYYAGPGQPLDSPRIVQDVTVDVEGKSVAVIEDLVDLGGTARFVAQYLRERGADNVVLVAPYLKNRKLFDEMPVITFGFVPPDTWIITPRERVETLIKRVPFWQEQGALYEDCVNNLREIGYPYYLIDLYLPMVYNE